MRQLHLQEVAFLHYLNTQSNRFTKLYGFTLDRPAMILKHYALGSLKHFMENTSFWSKKIVLSFALDIGRALAVMHGLGFAHCDIKADNI